MELTRASDFTGAEGIQFFIYGANGVGKTAESAAASGDRTVVLTDGNGVLTLKSAWWKNKYKCNPIIIQIKSDLDPSKPKLFDDVRTKVEELVEKHADAWDTLVIDDINTIRTAARNKAVDLNGEDGRSKTKTKILSGKFRNLIIPTVSDFGTEMGLMEIWFKDTTEHLRGIGKNCIVNAHERLYRNKEASNAVTAIKPLLTGQDTPDSIPGIFDMVWYARIVGGGTNKVLEYVTDSEAGIMAKSRLAGMFPNPYRGSLRDAMDRIKKWQTEGV